MRAYHSTRPASGAQRIVWLIPTLFLLGVTDTDLPTAACAAALVGVAWQVVYRRSLLSRLAAVAACCVVASVLLVLGVAGRPAQAGPVVAALVVLASALVVTEHLLRAADRSRLARDGRAVPAGT